jgi:hypothetical protein
MRSSAISPLRGISVASWSINATIRVRTAAGEACFTSAHNIRCVGLHFSE